MVAISAFRRAREKATTDQNEIESAMAKWDREHSGGRGPRGTMQILLDHIDHIVEVAGVDHVGLGSDYDGVSILPEQLDDASSYPLITQGLLDRGYSEVDIRKILGGNWMRVMWAVWG